MDAAQSSFADPVLETAGSPSPQERLIEAATRLFCRYGVNSVGVDAIVEAASTAKTTLYKAFGSKDGLVEAVLDREGRIWRTWFLTAIDGPGGSARERLARIGPALKIWFSREDFFGCPFINAVGESDKADDRMRAIAIAHKNDHSRPSHRIVRGSRSAGAGTGGAHHRPHHRRRDRDGDDYPQRRRRRHRRPRLRRDPAALSGGGHFDEGNQSEASIARGDARGGPPLGNEHAP